MKYLKTFSLIQDVTSPRASSHLPQSVPFSSSKSEGFSRLAELDAMVQNMLTPSTSTRHDALLNASPNSPHHNSTSSGTQRQCSLGAGSSSPKLPSLSPLQVNRNGNAGGVSINALNNNSSINNGIRFSGTDNSSSPGGSNSLNLPPPLKMPFRGSDGEDGFLELATRSTAPIEEKVG